MLGLRLRPYAESLIDAVTTLIQVGVAKPELV